MIEEIKYNGYSANPSDYECNDGDLAVAIDSVLEDGTLKTVYPPTEVFQLLGNYVVKYIHETSSFKHYIILSSSGQLNWCTDPSTLTLLRSFSSTEIYQVTGIGNTLIVLAADGMHYFLWKGEKDGYLYLGTEIPECPLSFGLQGEMIRTDEFNISFDSISEGSIWNEFTDSNKSRITSQVLAKVNKFIADYSTNKGKFIYPFLLRYAYRLYDGTLTKHSAPILMIASSDLAPQVFWSHIKGKGSYTDATLRVVGMFHTIDYAVVNQSYLNNLLNWKDIVSSVDVFVSKPIYTYDQNGECTRFSNVDEDDCYCVCKHINQAASTTTYPLRYQRHDFHSLYAFTYNPNDFSYPVGRLMLPARSVDDVKSDIKNCSQFYLLESLKIEHLTTSRTAINVEEDYLQSLVTREVMTDDYDSHDKIIPQYSFAYNSRLNVANIKKQLFKGHSVSSLFNYSNGYVHNWSDVSPTGTDWTESVQIYVYIKQDGKDIVVRGDGGSVGYLAPILFFFYPNTNAYKAVIYRGIYGGNYYEVPLEKHDFLNGSFYFGGWEDVDDLYDTISSGPSVSSDADRTIDIVNKIYTSEVNNPFYFPLLGINTVGTGKILGICAAAKALSQGQFGQFPLYAFTSEGVWALEVSDTGTYSAKQPITRDVCINSDTITQIDSAVLFSTDRGIMLISGSETQCISDTINSPDIFSLTDLPKHSELMSLYGSKGGALSEEEIQFLPFLDFISNCKMVYDYIHQRILIFNFEVNYGYVYSMKSKAWGMFSTNGFVETVPAYPEALVMKRVNKRVADVPNATIQTYSVLLDFSVSKDVDVTSLIITRPFKIGDPNMFKTIDTIIQRGHFKRDHVSQVLYGSNDLFNWHVVWSSVDRYLRGFHGTPYKAFRLALICKLEKAESIYGFTVQYNPRMNNQPR